MAIRRTAASGPRGTGLEMGAALSTAFCLLIGLASPHAAGARRQRLDPTDPTIWNELRVRLLTVDGATPTVAEDIARLGLSTSEARRAAARLVLRNQEALPALHAALLADDTGPPQRFAALQTLMAIGDPRSVPPIVELARRDVSFAAATLVALASMPPAAPASEYAAEIAADEDLRWGVKKKAYGYFGLQRDPRGESQAKALANDPEPERRAAGLFVLARLGDPTALGPITRTLNEGILRGAFDAVPLLLGLAELVNGEQLEARVPSPLRGSRAYLEALLYARYRTASPDDRGPICADMLRSETPGHLELAVHCLLEAGRFEPLIEAMALDLESPGRAARVELEVGRAGYRVDASGPRVTLKRR